MPPDRKGGAALHVAGKGREERIVPIQPDVLRLLRAYLDAGRTTEPRASSPAIG